MANPNNRLKPSIIADDIAALEAIQGMTGYVSARPEYALAALDAGNEAMDEAQKQETIKEGIAKGARDAANTAEWAFHNLIIGAKGQVKSKFGENSDELQSVGLKKKSEFKKPKKKTPPTPPTP